MTDTRELFEAAVVARMKESGFLEIEIRVECLVRCGEGYQDEVINAGWHYWQAARQSVGSQPLFGPYAHLNGPRALPEDSWSVENDPIENNEEYFSIPLFAKFDVTFPVTHGAPDAEAYRAYANDIAETAVAFGLEAQGHIPTIEAAISEGVDWQEIGLRINWDGETAKAYYERYLARQGGAV